MKNIDIVVPLFNEEEVVMEFFEALEKETSEIVLNNTELEFNFIFVDNGSVDDTHSILKKIGKEMKNFQTN